MDKLENLLKECEVRLYDASLVSENGRTIYRISIIKDGGVSLDDCERVSKFLSPIFDVEPPVGGDWVLEVSSPGLERVLKDPRHFENSIGELVKISTLAKEKLAGKLVKFDKNQITIELDDKQNKELNLNEIKKIKTYIKW